MSRLLNALQGRALAITLALFALLYGIARIRYSPPAPTPVDAAAERFSGLRARDLQARLVGDGSTRFIGTAGNARGRELIAVELAKSGWTVETQHARACTHHGLCGPVANVIGQLPGRDPSLPAVLLSAHHDSAPVAPGASDDGFGVAALLEAARALAQGPRPRGTIVALFTDGEEAGLLGASAFVRDHPLASTIRTTVNVDSRGSHGPSQMFETSAGNASLVALMAERLDRPVTTSLFYEVYRRMPNDTDFSITKTIFSGVNFANTAKIEHYHTPLDSLDNSSPATLQHHGDNVLAMARGLADASGPITTAGDAVWFDVLAFGLVRWPERWSVLLAAIGLLLVAGQAIRARAFDRGLAVFVPSLIAGVSASMLAGWILGATSSTPAPWVAQPLPALTALHAACGAGVIGVAVLFARRASPRALWAGTWLGWGLLAAVTAALAPGASYLFIVPTLVAGVLGSLPFSVACIAPAATAATLVFALATGVYEALGLKLAPMTTLSTLLLATTIAPMLTPADLTMRRAKRILAALGVLALGAAIVAGLVPKFTASSPQRANVIFRQDDKSARVFVDTTWGSASWGAAPPAMLAAIGGPQKLESALPWTFPALSAEAPRLDLKAPVAEILALEDDGKRHHVRMRVRSPRGATTLVLVFPRGRHVEVKVEGHFAILRPVAAGSIAGMVAVPEEGALVDLEAPTPGPIPFTLLDRTFGVAPGTKAEAAVRARPIEATPYQDGDVTVVMSALML